MKDYYPKVIRIRSNSLRKSLMDNSFPPAMGRVNVPDKHFGKFVSVLSKNFLSA